MKTLKLSFGVFFILIALILLAQAFRSSPPKLYEKFGAFLLAAGLAYCY